MQQWWHLMVKEHKVILSDVQGDTLANAVQVRQMDDFLLLFDKLDKDGFIFLLKNVDSFAFVLSGNMYATNAYGFEDPTHFLEARKLGFPIGVRFDDRVIKSRIQRNFPEEEDKTHREHKLNEMTQYLGLYVANQIGGVSFYRMNELGLKDYAEFKKYVDGQFKSSEEFRDAMKRGFLDSDTYRIAIKYGCSDPKAYEQFVQKVCSFLQIEPVYFLGRVANEGPLLDDALAGLKGGYSDLSQLRSSRKPR
jgi:hypothetical protein